jgi:hypothetical protein
LDIGELLTGYEFSKPQRADPSGEEFQRDLLARGHLRIGWNQDRGGFQRNHPTLSVLFRVSDKYGDSCLKSMY